MPCRTMAWGGAFGFWVSAEGMSAEYVQFKSDTIQCVVHDLRTVTYTVCGAGSELAPTDPYIRIVPVLPTDRVQAG